MRHKAYKFRMYPTEIQAALINRTFGCVRSVWNLMLADAKKNYKTEGKFSYSTPAHYKTEHVYLKEVDSMALCNAQVNLKKAFSRYFKDKKDPKKKRKTGFPNWKTRKESRRSYTTSWVKNNIKIKAGKLQLPKLGLVQVVLHRRVEGRIKSATVSQTASGHYYVSVLTEQADPQQTRIIDHSKVIGIDMSFSDIAVYSNGVRLKHPRWYRKSEKQLARAQQRLSRKKPGSVGREKQRIRVAKLQEKNSRRRADYLHKETRRLVDQYNVLVFEDINLVGMARRGKRRRFGKSVHDMGFGLFREFAEYKLEWEQKIFCKADRFYASTQLCSVCREKNSELKDDLSIRVWTCPHCKIVHDRDVNAAKNLVLWYSTGASPGIYAEGDSPSTGNVSAPCKVSRRTRKSCRGRDPASLSY